MRYRQIAEGERMKTEGKAIRFRCCDCSLIHLMKFEVVEGQVEILAWRDQKATTAARKRKKRGTGFLP